MAKGKKTGGRQPGTQNKLSSTVKDNVIAVFDGLGGVDFMQKWAKKNATEFFRIYSKLIPTDLKIGGDGTVIVEITKFSLERKPDDKSK